jgi:hypothetical protein
MQTVMKVVLLTLVQRPHPFFSCEEVWQTTRKKLMSVFPNLEESVHLSSFTPEDQAILRQAPTLVATYSILRLIRSVATGARAEKKNLVQSGSLANSLCASHDGNRLVF